MLGGGTAKLQLLLEMKNQMKGAFVKAKQMVSSDVNEMKSKLGELRGKASDTFESLGDSLPGVANLAGGLNTKLAAVVATLGLLLTMTGKVGAESTRMAIDWERGMAKVNVTAGLQKNELRDLSQEIRGIGARNFSDLAEVPEAFNRIISSGMDLKSSLDLLDPTLKASKAGFTDIETVAKAAVSAMASSGITDATRMYDILFATLNKGNAEFADIANYLPKIIPMARNAGITFEDTAGAFAYLTAQGFKAEAAATGLMNVFKSLSDTRTLFGSKTSKGFKGIGVEVFDATGKMKPFLEILQQLRGAMKGLNDQARVTKFDSIGLDMEASMTLSAMLQDYEKLAGIVEFTNNSQGQLNEALKNSETSLDNWTLLTNQVKSDMIDLGEDVLPLISRLSADTLATYKELKADIKELAQDSSLVAVAWENVENVFKAIGRVVDVIKEDFARLGDMLKPWMEGLENITRLIRNLRNGNMGFESVAEERRRKQEEKNWESEWGWRKDAMKDPAIVAFARENALKRFGKNPAYGMKATEEDAYIEMRRLTSAKKAFDFALETLNKSGDKKSLGALKDLGITSAGDFYRLMKEGTLAGVMDKLPGLMPKTMNAAGGGGAKGGSTSMGDTGVGKVVGSGQQIRNITVNFGSFIKGDIISQNKVIQNMTSEELKKWLQETMKSVIYSLETSYG